MSVQTSSYISDQIFPSAALPDDNEMDAITLQLAEIDIFFGNQNGKQPVNQIPDYHSTILAMQTELQQHLEMIAGLKFAYSLSNAIRTDADIIQQLQEEEHMAKNDREFALIVDNSPNSQQTWFREHFSPKQDNISVRDDFDDTRSVIAGPSGTLAASTVIEPLKKINNLEKSSFTKGAPRSGAGRCVACTEELSTDQTVLAPCDHEYCTDSPRNVFRRSTKAELYFPSKCCRQEIPLEVIRTHMSDVELRAFNNASIEFATHNRIYCHDPKCAAFIPPLDIETAESMATCNLCKKKTCTLCSGPAHGPGQECSNDTNLLLLLSLAEQERWRQCGRCHRFIELTEGYYHMR
jgi:hypothetical protein